MYKDFEAVEKWANCSKLETKIASFLEEPCVHAPRIPACSSSLAQVQTHFRKSMPVDVSTLQLYESILRVQEKYHVLAFLQSCMDGTVDELFGDVPTNVLSSMKGRPCRTRDVNQYKFKDDVQLFTRMPALLVGTSEKVTLWIKGKPVSSLNLDATFLAVLPTANRLEQFAIACSSAGNASLISTTRQGLTLVSDFSLDVPANAIIQWIECRIIDGKTVLYWGASDALRGTEPWSYFSGIENDTFFNVEGAEEGWKQEATDFTKNSNVLTLWTYVNDVETRDERVWKKEQQVLYQGQRVCNVSDISCVWGVPEQFVTLHNEGLVSVWKHGEVESSIQAEKGNSIGVLFAHR